MKGVFVKSILVILGVLLFSTVAPADTEPVSAEAEAMLDEAASLRAKAEEVLAEGKAKAARYRDKAYEARKEGAVSAGKHPSRTVIIMSKAEDKVERYNNRADKALAEAEAQAQGYLTEAAELEEAAGTKR